MRLEPHEVRLIEKLRAMPNGKATVVKEKGGIRDIQISPSDMHKSKLTLEGARR